MNMNRSRFASLSAVVAIAVAALVGGPTSMAIARHHCHRHHCHHHSGIPQNNGGDHDSDNSGAASDGDGNL